MQLVERRIRITTKQGLTALFLFRLVVLAHSHKSKATQISRVAFVVSEVSADKARYQLSQESHQAPRGAGQAELT